MAGVVAKLSIAPVKGTALHHPERVRLERDGVPENRRFYFVNQKGRLFAGSRHGPLVALRSSYDPDREWLELRFPDGKELSGPADTEGEAVVTSFWGRDVSGHVVEGPWSEAVSAYAGEPVRFVRSDRPGYANDSHAASLVSSASVRELSKRAGLDGELDARRFRMLIEVDGVGPHEEDTWIGCTLRVGGATIAVIRPDPRCVVTEQDPETGIRDFETRRSIRAYRRSPDGEANFGVYADVVTPGEIRVGDPVSAVPVRPVS
jgi:uncharacterized protein YcbX